MQAGDALVPVGADDHHNIVTSTSWTLKTAVPWEATCDDPCNDEIQYDTH
jgi:hypothetical protein